MARGKAPPARCKSIDNRYSVETSQTIGRPVVNWKPLRAGVIASNPLLLFSPPPFPSGGSFLHPLSSGCSIPSVGVAINAPLKEIGNPFVGTFVVVAYERRSSHELRQIHTQLRILHSICKGTFPHGRFSFSRGCTPLQSRGGEIAFTWSLESISRSSDTIGLFFRIRLQQWRWSREEIWESSCVSRGRVVLGDGLRRGGRITASFVGLEGEMEQLVYGFLWPVGRWNSLLLRRSVSVCVRC